MASLTATQLGTTVRKLHLIPPWAIVGSALTAIGSGLMVTFTKNTSEGKWIGYQILAGFGRGAALNMVRTMKSKPTLLEGCTDPVLRSAHHRSPGGSHGGRVFHCFRQHTPCTVLGWLNLHISRQHHISKCTSIRAEEVCARYRHKGCSKCGLKRLGKAGVAGSASRPFECLQRSHCKGFCELPVFILPPIWPLLYHCTRRATCAC